MPWNGKSMEQIEREAKVHRQSAFGITIERYGITIKLDPTDKYFGLFFIAVCAAAFCVFVICLSVYFLHRVSYSCSCESVQPKDFSSNVDHQRTFTPSVTENTNSLDLLFHSFLLFVILAIALFFKLFTFIITFVFTP
jgi:hypothetical protein